MQVLRNAAEWVKFHLDRRDFLGAIGLVLLWIGLDRLYSGAGMAVSGAILIAISVLVR